LIHGQVHPRDAAYHAYDKHLSPFHGWALRKIFQDISSILDYLALGVEGELMDIVWRGWFVTICCIGGISE